MMHLHRESVLRSLLVVGAMMVAGCVSQSATDTAAQTSEAGVDIENAALAAEQDVEPEEADFFTQPEIDYASADRVLGAVDSRSMKSLNGEWKIIVDPMGVGEPGSPFGSFLEARTPTSDYDLIEYNFETADTLQVPGDFNTQDERLVFYQGRVWYSRKFNAEPVAGQKTHLWFGGANFQTSVFLNGAIIGQHKGGYVPFSFDVTETLKSGENTLVVLTDNRLTEDTVPTLRTDWWPYGGLTRDVALVQTPNAFIRNAKIALTNRDLRLIKARVLTEGFDAGESVMISLPELDVTVEGAVGVDGQATIEFSAPVELWSPDVPQLYEVEFKVGEDTLIETVGFRTIETQGSTILLNGEPIKLRGISMHEEAIGRDGAAYSDADVRGLLTEAKALNANFVRAAHYPYSRHMAKAADELGIMLWEEVPVYWNIAWENPNTLNVARDQIQRLVERDWNRASVIIWSVANETPNSEPRMAFLRTLIDDARRMDDTRLISAALLGGGLEEFQQIMIHLAVRGLAKGDLRETEKVIFQMIVDSAGETAPANDDVFNLVIDDPLGEFVDLVGYNEYFGWYYTKIFARQTGIGEDTLRPLMLDFMTDLRISADVDKPIHISEFGAGAKVGYPGEGVWSEAYQAEVYRKQLEMLSLSPQVQGLTPWVLKDFRAMLRPLAGVQDYRNRKGLIDENGVRKEAFGVLQAFYGSDWAESDEAQAE